MVAPSLGLASARQMVVADSAYSDLFVALTAILQRKVMR